MMSAPLRRRGHPTSRIPRPFGLPLFELLAVGLLALLLVPWGSLPLPWRDDAPPSSIAYAIVTEDGFNGPYELIAFDEQSGEVQARLPGGRREQVVIDTAVGRLYAVTTEWVESRSATYTLMAYALDDWSVAEQVTLSQRPSALAASPDGESILLLFYDYLETFWLERRDADTLQVVGISVRLDLPVGCGASSLWTAAEHVLVLCAGMTAPLAVHAVDVETMHVANSLPLDGADILRYGRVAGLVVNDDRETLYIVFTDLQVLDVDARTLAVRRNVRDHVRRTQQVRAVAATSDMLLVAVQDELAPGAFAQLRRFAIPSLEELPAANLPDGPWPFAPGPDGMLYRWSSKDAGVWLVDPVSGQEPGSSFTGPNERFIVDVVRPDGRD